MPRLFRVLVNVVRDALDQGVRQPFFDRPLAPFIVLDDGLVLLFDGFCEGHQTFGGIRTAVQQHILDEFEQVFRDFFIDGQLAGIHDAHVETGLDGVIEKGRMHRFAHDVVAAERKRDIADAAADFAPGKMLLDPPRRLDEIHRIIVVLLDPGGDGQNVGIENNVLRTESRPVPSGSDRIWRRSPSCARGCPPVLFRRTPSRRRPRHTGGPSVAWSMNFSSPSFKLMLLTTALPWMFFSPVSSTSHLELSTMIGTLQISGSEAIRRRNCLHRGLRIQHALIHVDIDDLGAAFDLLPRDRQGRFVIAL